MTNPAHIQAAIDLIHTCARDELATEYDKALSARITTGKMTAQDIADLADLAATLEHEARWAA